MLSTNSLELPLLSREPAWRAAHVADYRFTDMTGRWNHISRCLSDRERLGELPTVTIASSHLIGWGDSAQSELALRPIRGSERADPFAPDATVVVDCHLVDPVTGAPSDRDSRATLERACRHLQECAVADELRVGCELEFYVFDRVSFRHSANEVSASIHEGDGLDQPASDDHRRAGGHRISYPAHQFNVGPADWADGFRSRLVAALGQMGVAPLHHHHEAGPAQQEVSLRATDALSAADAVQATKYAVVRTAEAIGQTATFMPKPMAYRSGSGLHMNLSLWKDGQPLFADGRPLSPLGQQFLAGIVQHGRALAAFLNPSANSYKRIQAISTPMAAICWGIGNRTVPIRTPRAAGPDEARLEVRFADATANPYLAFAALLLAGLDGIERQLVPAAPIEVDLLRQSGPFDPRRRRRDSLCQSLEEAVVALHEDHQFLLRGDSFSPRLIAAQLDELVRQARVCRGLPHPNEFLMSYGA